MVNLRGKRCEAPGCRRHPLYGHEGQRRRFCKSHREAGMVYKVGSNCQDPGCTRPARFGATGEEAKFCMVHKTDAMVDVYHRQCEEPHCKVRTGDVSVRARHTGRHSVARAQSEERHVLAEYSLACSHCCLETTGTSLTCTSSMLQSTVVPLSLLIQPGTMYDIDTRYYSVLRIFYLV